MNSRMMGLTGVFVYPDEMLGALKILRDRGFHILSVHSPARLEELPEVLGKKTSPVRYFTLTGGILGVLSGFGLATYTALQWSLIVSGKPIAPIPPYIIIAFEFCILLGVFFNLGGILLFSRLPKFRLEEYYDSRFSEDRYGLVVQCSETQREEVVGLLKTAGAEEVNEFGK